jgi:putative DNA primase/helicase
MSSKYDFAAHCKDACIKLWGQPDRVTQKELRWGDDSYNYKTYDVKKRVWYDSGDERGGSTLELVTYAKGEPAKKLEGEDFFNAWQYAHDHKWVPDPPPKLNGGGSKHLAVYQYNDENRQLLFEVVRFDTNISDDRFRQRKPDGHGGWTWKTAKVRKVLYRLPELIAAIKDKRRVLICEGERDANTAVGLGYEATTNPGGINKWRKEYDQYLQGADVVVVSDNDAHGEGQAHASKIARRVTGIAANVRSIMFDVKDLTLWVEAGHTREELDALIEATPLWEGKAEPEVDSKDTTDGGFEDRVALDFANQHADSFRFIAKSSRWMKWDGNCWRPEDTLKAFDESRKLCRGAGDARSKIVAAVVNLARTDRALASTEDQWDIGAKLLNTVGSTVDLTTGIARTPDRLDYITKITACAVAAPGTPHPLWTAFLEKVTGDNPALIDFLQHFLGYCLTGHTHEHVLLFLYGLGANGKSVFINTVARILGDYAVGAPMELFMASNHERHPTELAKLCGARLVTAQETEKGRRWDMTKIKSLTSDDKITGRFMRQDFFDFVPTHKLIITGNHKPILRTVDEAIRRRIRLVPFTVEIPKAKRDPDLARKLEAEWPAILRWMIDGCLEWQRYGLVVPTVVRDATDEYLAGQDMMAQWIDEWIDRQEERAFTLTADLFKNWKVWCEQRNNFIGTERAFSDDLADRGFENARKEYGRGFKGLVLRTSNEPRQRDEQA